ncbi:ABC transporter ATPase [Gammaproteobacteria bacterium]|nr:ABC transporter ATPase [Gammaproteobacteria bacterium]
MIKITQLYKNFGVQTVLTDINLEVKMGETVTIIGPSGSGKSTLIRCLNLLEKPTQGQISIDDISLIAPHFPKNKVHDLRQKVGMVFQAFNLFPHLTALENIAQGLISVKKLSKTAAHAESYLYLEKVGLSSKAQFYPRQLSGGQQQRVAIARALVMQPQVVLMDEPTSALDPELVQEVLLVIREVTQEKITSVIVTHELNFAQDISDRVIFMDEGKIIEESSPKILFSRPSHPRTQAFLDKFIDRNDFSI